MAEGWARHLKGEAIEAHSAGTDPQSLNPLAVEVMREVGVDISGHASKHVDAVMSVPFDYVVTVCGHADATCPRFPGEAKVVHHGFDDPPKLAADAQTEEDAMAHYRRVRDEIQAYVQTLPESLHCP
ncbi:Arsenate reductase [Nitrospina watsonii]|uniref:Arsenate reductase n=2 Tax=Nitrospina watsonii TaxID=1323948 RepID=A0ABM9HA03_9BACT|nr:Arsenate reductase [Nitrospina watsonii]